MNGFHDAANSVATVVSTRVLSPRVAVLWAAFFNFVAAFVFGVNVASTARIRGPLQPRARNERRAEDDGDHRRPSLRAGTVGFDVLRSVLRHTASGNRNGLWNLLRGMEDSPHNGHEDHEVAPVRRVQR